MHLGSALDRSSLIIALRSGASVLTVALLLLALAPDTADATSDRSSKQGRGVPVTRTLAALPPIAQSGTDPATPSDDGALVATFSPANPGQQVTLQRRVRHGWTTVARTTEDAWGSAAFSPRPGTYRAATTSEGRAWVTGTVTTRRWQPQFEDTFSGDQLDPAVWNAQRREHETEYAPRSCARVDASAHRVSNGVLHLGVMPDPERVGQTCDYDWGRSVGQSPYFLNTQVATEFTHFTRHGIIAARMRPQRADGMHSGFWLLPQGTKFTDGDPSLGAEIDVMEFWGRTGSGRESIGSHVRYYEPGWTAVQHGDKFVEARKVLEPGASWWDEFHVFSVEWTPEAYIFRVDGREYYRETEAVSNAQQYLVLSMLTADYELADLAAADVTDTAQVDWVRVYASTSEEVSRTGRGRRSAS